MKMDYNKLIFESCEYLSKDNNHLMSKSNIKITKIYDYDKQYYSFIIVLDNKYNFRSSEYYIEYAGHSNESDKFYYKSSEEFYNESILPVIRNIKINEILD